MYIKNKCSIAAVLIIVLPAMTSSVRGESYPRPKLDKTQHVKTIWSHANPWFAPNRPRTQAGGGPDFAWHRFTDDPVRQWEQVASRYKKYGLTGLSMEITDNAGWANVFCDALEGFRLAGNDMKLIIHLSMGSRTVKSMIANISKTMDTLGERLKNHPNFYRISGRPVIFIYAPEILTAGQWKQVISSIEAKYGSMVWLANIAHKQDETPQRLCEYMAAFDGVSMYGCWTTSGQRKLLDWLTPIMHEQFPQKIFEAAVHTNYTSHFHYGGMDPNLTQKYRDSWDMVLNAHPDSITITNWFDIWENSRIMPSYELSDIRLRIAEYEISRFHSQTPLETQTPDLYVANPTNVLLGQWLELEVLGFPCHKKNRNVEVQLELCDDIGNVVHKFEKRVMTLDKLKVERYRLPSENLAKYRALRPRLITEYCGRKDMSQLFPQTNIVTSIRPHLLFWCRSLKDMIDVNNPGAWRIGNISAGGTYILGEAGEKMIFSNSTFSAKGERWVHLLRNGKEIAPLGLKLEVSQPVELPSPGGALNWYNLELENSNGQRYLSPTIWVRSNQRPGMVKMPIWSITDTKPDIKTVEVEAVRVPFFQYDCDRDTGRILLDSSGYRHHGRIGKGHLSWTSYNHEHVGRVAAGSDPAAVFCKDSDGKGYLKFDGKGSAIIQGGTAFPYASTYEISIKPMRKGIEETILAAGNNQIRIKRLIDGRISASKKGSVEGEGGEKPQEDGDVEVVSRVKAPIGQWTNIAVVYDLKNLMLYMDGKLQDSKPLQPCRAGEWINPVVIGGDCKFPFTPAPSFKGGVRKIRLYGRNLSPDEFLCDNK